MYHVSSPEVGAEGEVISRKSVFFWELPKHGSPIKSCQKNHQIHVGVAGAWNLASWKRISFGEVKYTNPLGHNVMPVLPPAGVNSPPIRAFNRHHNGYLGCFYIFGTFYRAAVANLPVNAAFGPKREVGLGPPHGHAGAAAPRFPYRIQEVFEDHFSTPGWLKKLGGPADLAVGDVRLKNLGVGTSSAKKKKSCKFCWMLSFPNKLSERDMWKMAKGKSRCWTGMCVFFFGFCFVNVLFMAKKKPTTLVI